MDVHSITSRSGVRLHVVDGGKAAAQPILFIHGWSQSYLCWSRQFRSRLAERFRLVAFDLRGHGDSDKPLDGYGDSDTWASDLQVVIEALSLEQPVLVGWSYAGLIMNDYVRHFGQQRIGGLCYVGAATDLGIETPYKFLGASWNGLLPTRPDSVAGTVFSSNDEDAVNAMRLFLRGCFAMPLSPEDEMMMLGFNLRCPSRVRAALFSRVLRNDDLLTQLRIPALLIHGEADEVVRIETARHIASKVKGSSLSAYAGVGHAPFWEASERFNGELADFAASF